MSKKSKNKTRRKSEWAGDAVFAAVTRISLLRLFPNESLEILNWYDQIIKQNSFLTKCATSLGLAGADAVEEKFYELASEGIWDQALEIGRRLIQEAVKQCETLPRPKKTQKNFVQLTLKLEADEMEKFRKYYNIVSYSCREPNDIVKQ